MDTIREGSHTPGKGLSSWPRQTCRPFRRGPLKLLVPARRNHAKHNDSCARLIRYGGRQRVGLRGCAWRLLSRLYVKGSRSRAVGV